MKEINWLKVGDGYVAQFPYGKLTILPIFPVDLTRYVVRIESAAGKVITSSEFDLEGCKTWAAVNLPLLDGVSGEFGDCGKVQETLARCQQLLFSELDAVYWLWIDIIKAWMAARIGQPYTIKGMPRPRYSTDKLDWIEQDTEFVAETTYGRAIIRENRQVGVIGGGSRYAASIVHRSGASLDCFVWLDFVDAEQSIRKQLSAISKPSIDKEQLDTIRFTFDICQRVLPVETDPIHFARLQMLETRLQRALT
jgi:hypothetical protein